VKKEREKSRSAKKEHEKLRSAKNKRARERKSAKFEAKKERESASAKPKKKRVPSSATHIALFKMTTSTITVFFVRDNIIPPFSIFGGFFILARTVFFKFFFLVVEEHFHVYVMLSCNTNTSEGTATM
jgi:hypothetical protein